jgi:transposase
VRDQDGRDGIDRGLLDPDFYEILEQRGFEVRVVNARDAKHVPGRKTDVSDAAWLQRLHEFGLLRGGFWPQGAIAALRAYLRQRERLLTTQPPTSSICRKHSLR